LLKVSKYLPSQAKISEIITNCKYTVPDKTGVSQAKISEIITNSKFGVPDNFE